MEKKGFYYYLEDEKILEYMKLSTEEKLQWLEDIIEFTEAFLTEKRRNSVKNFLPEKFKNIIFWCLGPQVHNIFKKIKKSQIYR